MSSSFFGNRNFLDYDDENEKREEDWKMGRHGVKYTEEYRVGGNEFGCEWEKNTESVFHTFSLPFQHFGLSVFLCGFSLFLCFLAIRSTSRRAKTYQPCGWWTMKPPFFPSSFLVPVLEAMKNVETERRLEGRILCLKNVETKTRLEGRIFVENTFFLSDKTVFPCLHQVIECHSSFLKVCLKDCMSCNTDSNVERGYLRS